MRRALQRKRFIFTVLISFAITLLAAYVLIDVTTKKMEAQQAYPHVVEITDETDDPALWGANFPHQYAGYLKTVDQVRTKYGGSEAQPHTPQASDPRGHVAQSRLQEDPRLKTLWAGYAFATDFREERGHAYMLIDQAYTQRQLVTAQPGTCINCHASTYVAMKRLGKGNLHQGFLSLNKMPYAAAAQHVSHPVACIDCHTPGTMKLRVTRPAFISAIAEVKALQGHEKYDVNTMASPQEMRTFACAQCHVEYYFAGPEKTLTFPWKKGLRANEILDYYAENQHKDWRHKLSGAPVLKAQHPEFELYSQGIHARSGVSCADCHMPYERVGAMKVTDHHIRSPVLNLARSCQTCHRWPENELRARIEQIQDRTFELRGLALNALTDYIKDIAAAKSKISNDEPLREVYARQRAAQFYLDFIEAENSMGFHAPGEALRILGLSLENTRRGQQELHKALEQH